MTTVNKPRPYKSHSGKYALAVIISTLALGSALAGPTIQLNEEGFLQINYTFQMWAQQRDYTSATDTGSTLDFFLRRNRLTFLGQYNDYVSYYAQLESTSDSKAGNDNKSVYYRDAYLTLDLSDPVRFIIGRFKNTFSRENLEACFEPLSIDRAEVLAFTPWGGSRDTGIALWGNLFDAKFQYTFMVADGREGEEVVKDSPRLTARVHFSILDPEYDYGYRGTHLGTKKVLTIGAAFDYQNDVAYGDWAGRTDPKNYQAWTADLFFEYPSRSGTYTLSGAYMDYSVEDAINNPGHDPSLGLNTELEGYYGKLAYLLPGKIGKGRLQLFARHELSDYHLSAGSGNAGYYDQTWNSAGFNYYFNGQQLKITFEYAKIDFNQDHPGNAAARDNDQATLGLQMIF